MRRLLEYSTVQHTLYIIVVLVTLRGVCARDGNRQGRYGNNIYQKWNVSPNRRCTFEYFAWRVTEDHNFPRGLFREERVKAWSLKHKLELFFPDLPLSGKLGFITILKSRWINGRVMNHPSNAGKNLQMMMGVVFVGQLAHDSIVDSTWFVFFSLLFINHESIFSCPIVVHGLSMEQWALHGDHWRIW